MTHMNNYQFDFFGKYKFDFFNSRSNVEIPDCTRVPDCLKLNKTV